MINKDIKIFDQISFTNIANYCDLYFQIFYTYPKKIKLSKLQINKLTKKLLDVKNNHIMYHKNRRI
jgi:hypothetical protein